jgi:hypothetical protein
LASSASSSARRRAQKLGKSVLTTSRSNFSYVLVRIYRGQRIEVRAISPTRSLLLTASRRLLSATLGRAVKRAEKPLAPRAFAEGNPRQTNFDHQWPGRHHIRHRQKWREGRQQEWS